MCAFLTAELTANCLTLIIIAIRPLMITLEVAACGGAGAVKQLLATAAMTLRGISSRGSLAGVMTPKLITTRISTRDIFENYFLGHEITI